MTRVVLVRNHRNRGIIMDLNGDFGFGFVGRTSSFKLVELQQKSKVCGRNNNIIFKLI